jgi:hypothetical protein
MFNCARQRLAVSRRSAKLKKTLESPAANNPMAGYSATPLPQKLGIKTSQRVALINPPADFTDTLGELPPDVELLTDPRGGPALDVIVFFTTVLADLKKRFAGLAKRLTPAGGFWVAWPKKASGVATDLTEDGIRVVGLDVGLVDNKVCAIDDTWSGLRFVIRLQDRPSR